MKVGCAINLEEGLAPESGLKGKFNKEDGITIYLRNIYDSRSTKAINMFGFLKTMIHENVHYLKGTVDRAKYGKEGIAIAEVDCNLEVCTVLKNIKDREWEFNVGIKPENGKLLSNQFIFMTLANVYACNAEYKTKYGLTISKDVINAIETLMDSIDLLSINFLRNSTIYLSGGKSVNKFTPYHRRG